MLKRGGRGGHCCPCLASSVRSPTPKVTAPEAYAGTRLGEGEKAEKADGKIFLFLDKPHPRDTKAKKKRQKGVKEGR